MTLESDLISFANNGSHDTKIKIVGLHLVSRGGFFSIILINKVLDPRIISHQLLFIRLEDDFRLISGDHIRFRKYKSKSHPIFMIFSLEISVLFLFFSNL